MTRSTFKHDRSIRDQWLDFNASELRFAISNARPGNSRRNGALDGDRQQRFFDFAGPLYSIVISPASTIIGVGEKKELQGLPRERSRRRVDQDLQFEWHIVEGLGGLTGMHNHAVSLLAPL